EAYGEYIQKAYGTDFNSCHSLLLGSASRSTPDLSPIDCHAWLTLAIPTKDGQYKMLEMGKYARDYPCGSKDRIKFSSKTAPAAMTILEENGHYTHREVITEPFPRQR